MSRGMGRVRACAILHMLARFCNARGVSSAKLCENPSDLLPRLAALRSAGKTIVFGNGCFDIIHVGHVRYLQAAKALGDVLIIAVNTDESVKLGRPERMPVNSARERMEVLAALESVDFVVPLADRLPNALLQLYKPHIQAKGTDYTMAMMPERVVIEAYGGRIVFVGDEKTHSSTALREALDERRKR